MFLWASDKNSRSESLPCRLRIYYVAGTWVNPHMLLLPPRHSRRENGPVMEIGQWRRDGSSAVVLKVGNRSSGMKAALRGKGWGGFRESIVMVTFEEGEGV